MVDATGAGERDLELVTARLALVRNWLGEVLTDSPSLEITSASQDASARRYLRVRNGKDVYVVMDAPSQARGQESWLDVRTRLERAGLSVPNLYASDIGRGLLLISDLGFRHYLEELTPSRADALYADAISALTTMQSRICCNGLPVYDGRFLRRELDLFDAWFLRCHLEVGLSRGQRSALEKCFDVIIAACLEQEQVFVHRDYHSRNLMVLSRGNPGILDFQDAVRGPIGYDIASLFRDVYVSWPKKRVAGWVSGAYESLRDAGLLFGVEVCRFRRWVDLCGVQRHLKIAGIFSRLFHRDRKPQYLHDIPLTLRYLHEVSAQYPALGAIAALIDELDLQARVVARNARVPGGLTEEGTP